MANKNKYKELALSYFNSSKEIKELQEKQTRAKEKLYTAFDKYFEQNEDEVEDAVRHLRAVYPNVLRLEYDNVRMRQFMEEMPESDRELSPMEIFSLFFHERNGRKMNEKEEHIAREMILRLFDEEEGK